MGEKASVTLLFVALGMSEPTSAAWAKKDKVEVTLTAPAAGALYNAPAAITSHSGFMLRVKLEQLARQEFCALSDEVSISITRSRSAAK